ncbi:hypothetical protein OSTOST_07362, partial [Ostertagia ostertagi]
RLYIYDCGFNSIGGEVVSPFNDNSHWLPVKSSQAGHFSPNSWISEPRMEQCIPRSLVFKFPHAFVVTACKQIDETEEFLVRFVRERRL